MKIKPIILITGEPKSIFFEIFFKALKKNEYKSPLVLICCKETLLQEMKKNKFKKRIKLLNSNEIKNTIIDNRTLNIINIKYNFRLSLVKEVISLLLDQQIWFSM